MTNGGENGPGGDLARRARYIAVGAYALVGAAFAAVNAASELDERARAGRPVETWEPWAWELTSFFSFLLLAPFIVALAQRLWPPRLSWPGTVAAHLLLSVPASLAHTFLMIGMRDAIYWSLGDDYGTAGALGDVLLYEYRKDLLTYAALVLFAYVATQLLRGPGTPQPPDGGRLEVRDGSRTRWLQPEEIEWVQSAGNYVELRGPFGCLLHRRTLAALEGELAPHGFVRIHRSRLVRTGAISGLVTRQSGDFEISLASGETLLGSRRYRSKIG